MSHPSNDVFLEDKVADFDGFLKEGNVNEANEVISSLREFGFDKEANTLTLVLKNHESH